LTACCSRSARERSGAALRTWSNLSALTNHSYAHLLHVPSQRFGPQLDHPSVHCREMRLLPQPPQTFARPLSHCRLYLPEISSVADHPAIQAAELVSRSRPQPAQPQEPSLIFASEPGSRGSGSSAHPCGKLCLTDVRGLIVRLGGQTARPRSIPWLRIEDIASAAPRSWCFSLPPRTSP
jgi:hypothetical protein